MTHFPIVCLELSFERLCKGKGEYTQTSTRPAAARLKYHDTTSTVGRKTKHAMKKNTWSCVAPFQWALYGENGFRPYEYDIPYVPCTHRWTSPDDDASSPFASRRAVVLDSEEGFWGFLGPPDTRLNIQCLATPSKTTGMKDIYSTAHVLIVHLWTSIYGRERDHK